MTHRLAAAQLLAGLGVAFALTVAPPALARTAHLGATGSVNPTTVHTVVVQQIWRTVWHPVTTTRPTQTAPAPASPAPRESPAAPVRRPAQAQGDPFAPRPRLTGIPATSVPVAPPGPSRQQ